MALTAITNGDLVRFVSEKDPARTVKKVPVDPQDPSKGEKDEISIDYNAATVFWVRPLDVHLMGAIYDGANELSGRQGEDQVGIHTRINKTNIEAVKFGLAKWDNFPGSDGSLVHLKTEKTQRNRRDYEVVNDNSLNFMGIHLISEVADEIKRISQVSAQTAKN